ncbi:MAG: SBBP repeat-containing protein [Bacteroidetes bacterium]|nr:SBBP repeat-containing protein [Bacteroidota bacterium]
MKRFTIAFLTLIVLSANGLNKDKLSLSNAKCGKKINSVLHHQLAKIESKSNKQTEFWKQSNSIDNFDKSTNTTPNDQDLKAKAKKLIAQPEPLGFIENKGQMLGNDDKAASYVLFKAEAINLNIWVTTSGLTYQFFKQDGDKASSPQHQKNNAANIENSINEDIDKNAKTTWHRVDMILKGASIKKENVITEGDITKGRKDYYLAHCPNGIFNVKTFTKITIKEIYPGIDWVLYTKPSRQQNPNGDGMLDVAGLKHEFIVHPNANPQQVKLIYEGSGELGIKNNQIHFKNELGQITEGELLCYQGNEQNSIKSNYSIKKNNTLLYSGAGNIQLADSMPTLNTQKGTAFSYEVAINTDNYNANEILVIDPQLVWGTFFGGNGGEIANSCDTDSNGNLFVAGRSVSSSNFPILTPLSSSYFQSTSFPYNIIFISKFSNSGVLLWSTNYGGNNTGINNIASTHGPAVSIDALNNLFVTGGTTASNMPLQNLAGAYNQSVIAGDQDVFILKFNNNGLRLWATYYGGSTDDCPFDIEIDLANNVFIVGYTQSSNFPVQNLAGAYNQPNITPPFSWASLDAFIIKLSNGGTLLWGTYYGGSGGEKAYSVAIDNLNNLYVGGRTSSPNFPLVNVPSAYNQSVIAGLYDGFISKFTNTGALIWSTFYGGNLKDDIYSLVVDPSGNLFVGGNTESPNFPTLNLPGAYNQSFLGLGGNSLDIFILKFNSSGTRLWATCVGANVNNTLSNFSEDFSNELAVDACGNLYAAFASYKAALPAIGCGYATLNLGQSGPNSYDLALLKFSYTGAKIWSTYTNGPAYGGAAALSIDVFGNLFGVGYMQDPIAWNNPNSTALVNPGGGAYFDATYNGGVYYMPHDAFIMKFIPILPTYTQSQVNPTACSCNGVATLSVTCGEAPYSYQWSNAVSVLNTTLTTHSISGLCPGVYNCTITSNCNIVNVQSFTLTGPVSTLTANITSANASCASATGSITINSVSNGVPNYTITEGATTIVANVNLPYTINSVSVGTHTYIITSANGCSTTFTATILPGGLAPNLTAVSPVTLNCNPNTVTLNATTTTTGVVTYTWSGPGILSGSATPSVVVNQPGNYTVTIAQGACTNTAVVTVLSNTNMPNISITQPATLTCLTAGVTLIGNSTTSGVSYSWAPQNVTTNTAVASASGNYSLTVTNTVSGCTSLSVVAVNQNTTSPNISITQPATLTCLATSITLVGNSTTSGVNYSWSPQNVATNTTVASIAGNYSLTVTHTLSGCVSTSVIAVSQNTSIPNISITQPATLNCLTTSLTLLGNSITSGVTYSWSPQNVTTSTAIATSAGNYTFTVTDSINGCNAQLVQSVLQNTVVPNISANVSGSLTCSNPSVTITGNSTTSGVTYSWSPNVISAATLPVVTVNSAGNYTLTAINPLNSCVNSTIVAVMQNGAFPNISITQPASLTCLTTSVTLIGTSTTSGVTYSWTPQNVSTSTAVVTMAGNYTLEITNPLNGCTSSSIVAVTQNTTMPILSVSASGVLTCLNTSVILTGVSSNNIIVWNGGLLVNATNPSTVNATGIYTATSSNSINGCSTSQTLSITQNTLSPSISATTSATLTCTNTFVNLTGTSATSGVIYSWTPQNVNTNTTIATSAGNYSLTVTNPLNGCSTQTVLFVSQNTNAPIISATTPATLTCTNTLVTLTGTSATSGVTYSWAPQNVTTNTAIATTAGNYSLTVSDPSNGCVSSTVVAVTQNGAFPNISITQPASLTCLTTSVTLIGTSTTSGVTYSWSPQNVSTSTAIATSAGNYTFSAYNTVNGCMSTSIISVSQNTNMPNISTTIPGTLTCANTSVTLIGSSTTSGVTYSWSPNVVGVATLPVATAISAGNYTFTVTNPVNGCFVQSSLSVIQNTSVPNISATQSGNLDCHTTSITLSGTSTTGGVIYQWSGGPSSSNYTIYTPSTFSLTVTNPANGCSSFTSVVVSSTPVFTANIMVLNQINCFANNNGAIQINNLGGGLAPFVITNLNNNNQISNVSSFPFNLNSLSAGNYSIQVSDANGCSQTLFANINQPPALYVGLNGNTTLCEGQNTNIISTVNGGTAPYSYIWSPSGSNASALNVSPAANTNFTLMVTDNNGCQKAANIAIIINPKPNASLVNDKLFGCSPICASFSLSQNQNINYSYNWSFTNNSTGIVTASSLYNPDICFSEGGTYNAGLTITSIAGCTTSINYANLITVYNKPRANFSFTPDKPSILEPEVNFTNLSAGASSYVWYNVNTIFSYQTNPSYTFQDAGTFLVTLIASNGQCSDTISKAIVIDDEFLFYIPNTFTPNEDNLNDLFYPVMSGYSDKNYSFMVFDRWGAQIFSTNDTQSKGWDGFYKGELCKSDVYVWKINVTTNKGKAKEFTGHINLIK